MALLPANRLNISATMDWAAAGLPFSLVQRTAALCDFANCSGGDHVAMNRVRAVFSSCNDALGLVYVGRCAMDNEQKLAGFQGHVVLGEAIVWDTEAYQACSHCTHSPDNRGAFKTGDDHRVSSPTILPVLSAPHPTQLEWLS